MSKNNRTMSAQKNQAANNSGASLGQSANNQLINYGNSLVDFARKTAATELNSQNVNTHSTKRK